MADENAQISAFRIIDASLNRAMEGLRVVEEFTRMHLSDAWLSKQLKNNRHQLANLIAKADSGKLIVSRDVLRDVGTGIQTQCEYQRKGMNEIVRANFARVLQSLRSIEEYSKLVMPNISVEIERLRYQIYSLEKAIVNSIASQQVVGDASVYVLVDRRNSIEEFESLVVELIDADVDFIQLRDKQSDDRGLIEAGLVLSSLTKNRATRWIINDRPDLAVATNADGVHVGQTEIDVASARRIVGFEKLIGVSTHNIDQARQAVLEGANYIGMGPMFPSETKAFDTFASQDFVRAVVAEISLPAFAIGGIDETNVDQLLELGIKRIAVSHAVVGAQSPGTVVSVFKKKLVSQAVSA